MKPIDFRYVRAYDSYDHREYKKLQWKHYTQMDLSGKVLSETDWLDIPTEEITEAEYMRRNYE